MLGFASASAVPERRDGRHGWLVVAALAGPTRRGQATCAAVLAQPRARLRAPPFTSSPSPRARVRRLASATARTDAAPQGRSFLACAGKATLFRHVALSHSSPRTRCVAISPPGTVVCPLTAPASPLHTARARGRLAYPKRCAGWQGLLWDTTNAHGACCAARDATRTRVRARAQAARLLLRNLERSARRIPGLTLMPQICRLTTASCRHCISHSTGQRSQPARFRTAAAAPRAPVCIPGCRGYRIVLVCLPLCPPCHAPFLLPSNGSFSCTVLTTPATGDG
jgi:hypothetical protein